MDRWPRHGGTEYPTLDMMRPFGCICYSGLLKEQRRDGDKLSRMAEKGVLVGYATRMQAWKVYFPEKGLTLYRANVRFIEDMPPPKDVEVGDEFSWDPPAHPFWEALHRVRSAPRPRRAPDASGSADKQLVPEDLDLQLHLTVRDALRQEKTARVEIKLEHGRGLRLRSAEGAQLEKVVPRAQRSSWNGIDIVIDTPRAIRLKDDWLHSGVLAHLVPLFWLTELRGKM